MTLNGILVILGLIAAFAAAMVIISKEGGWNNAGCHGDCANCGSGCAEHPKKNAASPEQH